MLTRRLASSAYKSLCQGNSPLTQEGLIVRNPSDYSGIKDGKDGEKTLGRWWEKNVFSFRMPFKSFFSQLSAGVFIEFRGSI